MALNVVAVAAVALVTVIIRIVYWDAHGCDSILLNSVSVLLLRVRRVPLLLNLLL